MLVISYDAKAVANRQLTGDASRRVLCFSLSWPVQTVVPTGRSRARCSSPTHTHRASYSLTVFSPSGKLVQIEHALAAVAGGTTSLGIKGAAFAYALSSH
jgi:hypothetical protein